MVYVMSNLSLAAEVMYISVSPGFWMIYPMILEWGLQMTLTCLHRLSGCVGKCSIARP